MPNTKQAKPSNFNAVFCQRYGPWAVVTGASEGIGLAFAECLAAKGLNLLLVARRQALLESLAQQLRNNHGIQCLVVTADLGALDGNETLLAAAHGLEVGLLVANAGFGSIGALMDADLALERQMLPLNCAAVLGQCARFGKAMALRGRGGLVLMSSVVAFQGAPLSANYAATKAYVQTLAEGLAIELQSKGVDVLAVAPGPVHTGFASRANMQMAQALDPVVIAQGALAALGRRTTVRPGWLSKVLGWSLASSPRWLGTRIMGQVMRGMAKPMDATAGK